MRRRVLKKNAISDYSKRDLSRMMSLILWIVPAIMAFTGIAYTLYENRRHIGEPSWPWLTWFGVVVLGVIGPTLSWLVLRWAINVANAYLVSQEQLNRRADELAVLNELSISASRSLDLEKTISTILEGAMDALEAVAGMVFIQQDGNSGLRLEAHRGISVEMAQKEARLSPGHCLCGQAVATRKVLMIGDVGRDSRCTSNLCICEGFRSIACAPLEVKGELVGLLQLASPKIEHFSIEQSSFLAAAAAQVSTSIENARLYEKVRDFNVELERKVNQRTRELEAARWALSEKARQLQRLLGESYRVQEDTQTRIAQDMHDSVTQTVIGALYETQAARESLLDNPDLASENLARAQQLLTDVEVEIRRVIYDLHPPVLDMMGMVTALKRFATTYSTTFSLPCNVRVTGKEQRLEKEIEIAIYRIVQAALHNVAAHANAREVEVRFNFRPSNLRVAIEDNGIGFDPQTIMDTPGEHLGLIGMKERAEGINGTLLVESVLNEGTRVSFELPEPYYIDG